MSFQIELLRPEQVHEVVALQPLAFPLPFNPDLHWDEAHLQHHLEVFPEGQWVAVSGGRVVGACSNMLLSEANWRRHASWMETVGGPFLKHHDPKGTTLYGLDIAVDPAFRRMGIGTALYHVRKDYVTRNGLARYGTACRMPDFQARQREHPAETCPQYAKNVVAGKLTDRTLTPLLAIGLTFLGVISDYMEDPESDNSAALLEWTP